jgi:hypothetical protein
MNSKMLLAGIVLLLVGIPVSADPAERPKPAPPGLQVSFNEEERTEVVLGPGEQLVVAVACGAGEVVVSGGYSINPSDPPLRVTINSPFFDGVNSGWRTDFHNEADTTVTVSVRVYGTCTKGTGTPGYSSAG